MSGRRLKELSALFNPLPKGFSSYSFKYFFCFLFLTLLLLSLIFHLINTF
jgi:hypothetical protein